MDGDVLLAVNSERSNGTIYDTTQTTSFWQPADREDDGNQPRERNITCASDAVRDLHKSCHSLHQFMCETRVA